MSWKKSILALFFVAAASGCGKQEAPPGDGGMRLAAGAKKKTQYQLCMANQNINEDIRALYCSQFLPSNNPPPAPPSSGPFLPVTQAPNGTCWQTVYVKDEYGQTRRYEQQVPCHRY